MKTSYQFVIKNGRVVIFKEYYDGKRLIKEEEISERQYVNENPLTNGIGYSASGLSIR